MKITRVYQYLFGRGTKNNILDVSNVCLLKLKVWFSVCSTPSDKSKAFTISEKTQNNKKILYIKMHTN